MIRDDKMQELMGVISGECLHCDLMMTISAFFAKQCVSNDKTIHVDSQHVIESFGDCIHDIMRGTDAETRYSFLHGLVDEICARSEELKQGETGSPFIDGFVSTHDGSKKVN